MAVRKIILFHKVSHSESLFLKTPLSKSPFSKISFLHKFLFLNYVLFFPLNHNKFGMFTCLATPLKVFWSSISDRGRSPPELGSCSGRSRSPAAHPPLAPGQAEGPVGVAQSCDARLDPSFPPLQRCGKQM